MKKYRVLLVDDEAEIRQGISSKIDWTELGFELVGEAENGVEALELAEQLTPDVVLTDIKMPFMDGLTLCRNLKQSLPAAKLVMFSGFDEFEYARQAIGIHVSDYILKPVDAQELTEILKRLHEQLEQQYREHQDIEMLRRRYEESLPLLREFFYVRLLDGHIPQEQLAERAKLYGVNFLNHTWVAVLLRVSPAADEVEDVQLLSVRDFYEENFSLEGCSVRGVLYNDAVALLADWDEAERAYPFAKELARLSAMADNSLGLCITAGIGTPCADPGDLHNSIKGAKAALEYSALTGSSVIFIDDLEPDHMPDLGLASQEQELLVTAVKFGTEQLVRDCIRRMMNKMRDSRLPLPQCHLYVLETVIMLVNVIHSSGVESEAEFGGQLNSLLRISEVESMEQLEDYLVQRALQLREMLGSRRIRSNQKTIELAKTYIHDHFSDCRLSVEQLSRELRLSPAYFSTLFKKETGVSFTNYVAEVRMTKAAALLRTTDAKTYEVAEKTGYADPNYFSYVFKRYFNMPPSKFRSAQHT